VLGAVKFLCAANPQRGRAIACDAGSHFAQHDDEVGDFRFGGRRFLGWFSPSARTAAIRIFFRAGDSDFVEDDVGAFKAAAIRNFRFDVAMAKL